jgi:diguanylate cyclase (GGDEF)-like protein
MGNKLKEITFNTFKSLKNQEIVLPLAYSEEFEKHALAIGLDLENYNIILEDLNQDNNKLNEIIRKTNQNLNTFHESTKRASKAIEDSNSIELQNIQSDIEAMKKEIEFLQKELFTDSLTKVYNRKWFKDIYLHNDTFNEDGFLAFIDLNKFKEINDNYGHLIGDQVLKYLCNYIRKELSKYNISIVRYGGDEFIILFNKDNNNIQNLNVQISNMQTKLYKQKLQSKNANNATFNFTFAFGIVKFQQYDSADSIIKEADAAMYENKIHIKNNLS